MSEPRISVIVPTVGRPTLERALASAQGAYEVLVDHNRDGDRGYAARNRLMAQATGTHCVFVDDDDEFAPGAIEAFMDAARANPDRPTIFRMSYENGLVLWQQRVVAFGMVGTPMLLVPNIPGKLGTWRPYIGDCGGDFSFILDTCDRMGDPAWDERIVAHVRPAASVAA